MKKACFAMFSILFITVFCHGFQMHAQNDSLSTSMSRDIRKNAVYFEVLGNGVIYSINYDRMFCINENGGYYFRVGGNEYHGVSNDRLSFNIITSIGIIRGAGHSFFESSLGYTHFLEEPDKLIVLTFGYRLQGKKGLLLRASPMFVFNTNAGDTFKGLWFGLSFGYAF